MTGASATPDGVARTALPDEVEAAVYEGCFGAEPRQALRQLAASHPVHAIAIESLGQKVLRANGVVVDLHRTATAGGVLAIDAAEPVPERFGAYRVVRELGRGSFGVVWLAEQQEPLQRLVALKVLRKEAATAEVLQRFAAERKALAAMDHPGIAHIYEAAATASGQPYFAMEYIAGEPLTGWCDARRLPVAARLRLFLDAGAAVLHAHQRGVLHRDLKPANILVAEHDGQPFPKVIDFGLAKALQHDSALGQLGATIEGKLLGTPEYMAPEQAAGRAIDTRADIWALGVVLFELLSGALPFPSATLRAEGLASVVRTLAEQDAPRLTAAAVGAGAHAQRATTAAELQRALRGDLEAIVAHCLRRNPDDRYPGVADLLADLRRHLVHEPIAIRPLGLAYGLRKLARRHRALVLGAAVALAGLVIATVVTTWSLVRVTDARDTAVAAADAASWAAYTGAIAAASNAGAMGRGAELAQQLENAPTALRHLEWRLLAAQTDDALLVAPSGIASGVGIARLGERLVIADDNVNCVRLFDPATRAFADLPTPPGTPRKVAAERAGRRVAVTFQTGGAWVVTAAAPEQPLRLPLAVADPVVALPAALEWVACGEGPDLVLRGLPDGVERLRARGHRQPIVTIALSDDDTVVATGDTAGVLRLWRRATGEPFARLAAPAAVWQAVFTNANRRLATAGFDGVLRLWDVNSGELVAEQDTHAGVNAALASSADGRMLLSGGADGSVDYWDPGTLRNLGHARGHTGYVCGAAELPDGRFATHAWDGEVRLWPGTPPQRNRAWSGIEGNAAHLVRSPTRPLVFVGTLAGQLGAFDLPGGAAQWERSSNCGMVQGLDCTADGAHLVVAGEAGTVHVVDPATGVERTRQRIATGLLGNLVVLDRRREIVTCDALHVHRLSLPGLEPRGTLPLLPGVEGSRFRLATDAAERLLAAACDTGVQVFDLERAATLWSRPGFVIARAAFAPDGGSLFLAGSDGYLHVVEPRTGVELRRFGKGPGFPMASLAMTPDGERLLIADQQLRIWSTAHGEELLALPGRRYLPHAVLLLDDLDLLLTGGGHFDAAAEILAWPLRRRAGR